ncbi:MAG: hypothetical protein FWD64_02660, partial [Acidobacteriaceae bacterium]|nr:hypothetical protein [Acidobacteriaceae bacterium]
AVFFFTDGTATELRKASSGKAAADDAFASASQDARKYFREQLHENVALRLLADVLSPAPGGYFMAYMHGASNHHLIFTLDPHGVPRVAPEEVVLRKVDTWGSLYLLAFRSGQSAERNTRVDNVAYSIDKEDLDVSIQANGFLTGKADVHVIAMKDGLTVVPLLLYPTLRVSKVTADGIDLGFVQEDKDKDPQFGIILAKPLNKGESATIRIAYAGKDVVLDEGNHNYYPVARESWFPNTLRSFGNYATYHMLFHVPKGLELIATGTRVREDTDGKVTTSEWNTEVPLPVAGFTLGEFNSQNAVIKSKNGNELAIDAYANKYAAENNGLALLSYMRDRATGNFVPSAQLPVELSQGQVAASLYTHYFGELPFKKVSLTQQYACDYGQSWPMLVYLPLCGFMDKTQQHELGIDPTNVFWKVVTPHEVAHQWWGHTVGFNNYRDQWMSEGFADASASIFLQATRPNADEFLQFWKDEHDQITQKNQFGFRSIDVGPVTMGFRLSTPKTGWNVYRNLVYPKGAYILHMLRMMMWSSQNGDKNFMEMMHDFVSTYYLKPATTEDFKAMVEKHMTPDLDLDQNHRMDWFFNQYVYGTDLPTYHFEGAVTEKEGGASMHFKLVQSGVTDDFKMVIPIYLEFKNGKVIQLGKLAIFGNQTLEQTVPLPKLPDTVKKVSINYNYDVLSIEN